VRVSIPNPSFNAAVVRRVAALVLVLAIAGSGATHASPDVSAMPLFKALSGKVILLDFWASWCQPCRQSFPWMASLQRRYGSEGLVVIAVNLDRDRRLAERFLAQTPAEFRIEYDPQATLATEFGVTAMPMSFLIDRQGRVREQHAGFRAAQRAERETLISRMLKE
jgi:cytochrome c biogenesis protein CcmG, thiol:disulfide interchange protein DsbE